MEPVQSQTSSIRSSSFVRYDLASGILLKFVGNVNCLHLAKALCSLEPCGLVNGG